MRIRIGVPPRGFGTRLDQTTTWLDTNVAQTRKRSLPRNAWRRERCDRDLLRRCILGRGIRRALVHREQGRDCRRGLSATAGPNDTADRGNRTSDAESGWRTRSTFFTASAASEDRSDCRRSRVVVVNQADDLPFVESQAGMRNPESDHIPDLQKVSGEERSYGNAGRSGPLRRDHQASNAGFRRRVAPNSASGDIAMIRIDADRGA